MKKNIPLYLKEILELNPNIASGRKNFQDLENRIKKNINLIKKHLKEEKKS
tara:strand:- start:278 stop:430 length:153 start_codon:yes stop_codon:yes gene_type:complete